MDSLPTPPNEEHIKPNGSRKSNGGSKPVKTVHRASKRASNPHVHTPSPTDDGHSHHSMVDGRHKRVWKACERCRMKKTKCDGEFPCKRCKDDGLVCTAGTRKKTEYKQLPRGYAEVLENTQFALIATVHKLYSMVRNQQQWELGEPELNDRGQPIIHNIASKLGCIRPNSDIDLPVHSVFPEDEAGLAELARQLEEQQHEREAQSGIKQEADARTDRASSSELDHSDSERDYYYGTMTTTTTGGRRLGAAGSQQATMSPQSLTYNEFEAAGANPTAAAGVSSQSPSVAAPPYDAWLSGGDCVGSRPASIDFSPADPFLAAMGTMNMDLLNQGLLESNFGTIKPHVLSCANPEVMMGMGDPMIYSGYDADQLRL